MPTKTRAIAVTVRERTPFAHPVQPTQPHENDVTRPLSFSERMLRSTAISVALLLAVMAVSSLQTPETGRATNLIAQAVTMDISESLGSLRFVANLLPESVAVFWNLGSFHMEEPSQAALLHTFSGEEPWLAFGQGVVTAGASGEVLSISPDPQGAYEVTVRHASEMTTLYGNLHVVAVREGDAVSAGTVLGEARLLTFELLDHGRSINPAPYLP